MTPYALHQNLCERESKWMRIETPEARLLPEHKTIMSILDLSWPTDTCSGLFLAIFYYDLGDVGEMLRLALKKWKTRS